MDMLISNKLNQNKKDQKQRSKAKKILLRNFGDSFFINFLVIVVWKAQWRQIKMGIVGLLTN